MTNETKKLLEEALKSSLAALQSGVDFAKTEIPLALKEKLSYDFWEAFFEIVFFTLLLLIFTAVMRASWKRAHSPELEGYDGEEARMGYYCLAFIPFGLTSLVWIITTPINILTMIKITVAPRLYLLEWLKEFIK